MRILRMAIVLVVVFEIASGGALLAALAIRALQATPLQRPSFSIALH
jgi:hypothetical protein